MTKNAQFGIAVGLLAVVAAAVFVTRQGTPTPTPASSFNPVTVAPDAAPRPSASVSPLAAAAIDAGVTPTDLRNWRTRIDTELCSKAGEQINKLDGRAPTDPKAINSVSLCLQYGNVAWYKCLLDAKDVEGGKACNARFLQPPP